MKALRIQNKTAFGMGVFAFLTLGVVLFIKYLHRNDFECAIGFDGRNVQRTPCRVNKEQNILALSGFRNAPIFTLSSSAKASDHREASYDVVRRSEGTLFKPESQNPYDAIMIFGLNLD
ncbi:MAG: hypothetical protein RIR26_2218 [Pseudomonadota bacterium]